MAFHSLVYSLGSFLNKAVGFLMIPVYTRFLQPTEYGILEMVGITTELLAMVLTLRINRAMYRFYFEYDTEQEKREVISTAVFAFGGIGLLGLIVACACSGFLAQEILDSSNLSHYFIISFTTLWFSTIVQMALTYLQIKKQSIKFIVFSLARLIIALTFNVYFIVYLKMGVLGMLYGNLIAAISLTVFLVIPVMIQVGFRFSRTKLKHMLQFSIPMIPGAFANFIVLVSDRYMVKAFGSLADAGIYSLSYKFSTIPHNFLTVPFFQIWSVRRFELFKQDDSEVIMGKIITYFMFFLVFIGLGISVLAKEVIQLMADEKYWSAHQYIPILILSYIVFGLFNHFVTPILISKKTHLISYIDVSNGIITILLNLVFIKYYGIYGAAFATLISYFLRILMVYYIGNKIQKIYFEGLRMLKLLLGALIVFMLCGYIEMGTLYSNVLVKFGVALTFPLILFCLCFYTKQELVYFSDIVKKRRCV